MEKKTDAKKRETAREKMSLGYSLCGFKSIACETELEIKPLTILAGANSSGKSSIMQPLLLMKQTLESAYDPGALLLDGPNIHLSSSSQILSIGKKNVKGNQFWVKIILPNGVYMKILFSYEKKKGFVVENMEYGGKKETTIIKYIPENEQAQIRQQLPKALVRFEQQLKKIQKGEYRWVVTRNKCFLGYELKMVGQNGKLETPFFSPSYPFESVVGNLLHVPALRGNPKRSYVHTAIENKFPGTFEHYVASIITKWQNEEKDKFIAIQGFLEKLGLSWKISARKIDDTHVELRVGRLAQPRRGGAEDLVNISDVGFGVSQVLPVLVALALNEKGRIIYIEEPEIHLHPRAQFVLGEIIAECVGRGGNVIIETHSSILLRGIQKVVASRKLSPEKVSLNWFSRDRDGVTTIASDSMGKAGTIGSWPVDFGKVDLDTQDEYYRAVEQHNSPRSAK